MNDVVSSIDSSLETSGAMPACHQGSQDEDQRPSMHPGRREATTMAKNHSDNDNNDSNIPSILTPFLLLSMGDEVREPG